MHNVITIASTSIRQDAEGRFCLNDLHKAAGGRETDAPGRWTRLDSFRDLIEAIQQDRRDQRTDMAFAPFSSSHGGANPGIYVVKELVYAYAMWISAKFHLQVIRAYDQMVTAPVAPRIPTSFREALLLAAAQQEQLEEAQLQLSISAPKAQVYDAVVASKFLTLSAFARMLPGVNSMAIKKDLLAMNYLYRVGSHYKVYSQYRDVLFAHTIDGAYGTHDISVLAKGKELLVRLHADNRLTMKAGF